METVLIHLLKSSALLAIFLASYLFLLRKESSFVHNRIFLLAGILSSFILPFVTWTKTVVIEAPLKNSKMDEIVGSTLPLSEPGLDWWEVLGAIYLLGLVVLLFRITFQLVGIFKLSAKYSAESCGNLKIIETKANISPFSFFNLIVYNPDRHFNKELKIILEHEKIHVRQLHSIDILLATLTLTLLWFNPFSWFYKKMVEQNLEFLADKNTLKVTGNKKEYQYALLRLSTVNPSCGLTSPFQESFIKDRILMLEKNECPGKAKWKYLLVIPMLLLFLYSCNVQEEVQVVGNDYIGTNAADALQEPLFLIDQNTSRGDLRTIEKYFSENYSLQLAFTGVKHSDGLLSGFRLSTRFEGQEHFVTRMENFAHDVLKPKFVLQFEPDEARLRIIEIAGEEIEFEITEEAIHASKSLIRKEN